MNAVHKLWTRIFACAVGLLLLLFFSNDFGLIDIQDTAIDVALGIDTAENGEGYDVTAQIAVPASTGSGSAGNVTVKNARTVGEAIAELNHETGWYPTLVHCRLVLLGADTVSEDVFSALDYFLRSEFVEDSCLVAVCEKSAAETLQANSPVGDLPSSAISKVLSAQAQKTGQVSVCNLRDFAKGYFSQSASGYLPVLSVKNEAKSEGGQESGGAQGAQDGKKGGGSGGEKNDAVEDSCLVAACSGTAREVFQAQSPVNDISASAITKVLSSEAQKSGIVAVNILKDFAKQYYSVSESGFLPYISVKSEADSQGGENAQPVFAGQNLCYRENAQPVFARQNLCRGENVQPVASEDLRRQKTSADSPFLKKNKRWRPKREPLPISAAATEGGAGGSGGQQKNGDGNADIFQADKTMLFYKGKRAALLDAEETLAYNLADTDTGFAFGNVTVDEDGTPVTYTLKMKISKKKQKLFFENGMPVFTFDIRANARISDADKADSILGIAKTLLVDEKILHAAEEKFREELLSVFTRSAAAGCDVFALRQKLYRHHFGKYEKFKDTLLDSVQVRGRITFTSLK